MAGNDFYNQPRTSRYFEKPGQPGLWRHNGKSMKILPISLLAGLFGLVGGTFVWLMTNGSDYQALPLAAGLGAFGTTAFFWRLIVVRCNNYTARAGMLTGGLSGIASHWVCWYLYLVGVNICYGLTGGCVSSLNEPPLDPLNGLWGTVLFSLVSLMFLGWITVPLGMAVGAWWAWKKG